MRQMVVTLNALIALVAVGHVQAATPVPVAPTDYATSFWGSIGINATAGALTASQLQYVGIKHVRTGPASAATLAATCTSGAHLDILVPWYNRAFNTADLSALLASFDTVGCVEDTEYQNEVDQTNTSSYPGSFNGLPSGPLSVVTGMATWFKLEQADKNLNSPARHTPVLSFTILQGRSPTAYGDQSASCNLDNMHLYGAAGAMPQWILPVGITQNKLAPSRWLYITETGATTIQGTGVSQTQEAIFDVDAVLDAFKLRVARTYLFTLTDWANPGASSDFSAYYGMFDADGTPKIAAAAFHNLATLLVSSRNYNTSFAKLTYALSGTAYYAKSMLLQNASGAYDLIVWNETAAPVPTSHITVTLGTPATQVAAYDPVLGATPLQVVQNAATITVPVTADPVVFEIRR